VKNYLEYVPEYDGLTTEKLFELYRQDTDGKFRGHANFMPFSKRLPKLFAELLDLKNVPADSFKVRFGFDRGYKGIVHRHHNPVMYNNVANKLSDKP
jgi:hypothetical protein